ncbi:MAG: right-handed parallel beta-helix repeat-containing protein, partial [Actinophytocola sp.]|nr:right-handed parallel beta-helix repeat-containing protein [Actinophytocola sp.]
MTEAEPPHTTFWLAPGVHRLGAQKYDQVVPKKGNTYIGAPGAVLDGQRSNRYAFTGDTGSVTIRHLTIQNFGVRGGNNNEGVVNHDSASGWRIERSTVRKNAGAGVMLGSRNQVRDSCLSGNGQYGFNAYHANGVTDLTLA